jgi:hypothetical protein
MLWYETMRLLSHVVIDPLPFPEEGRRMIQTAKARDVLTVCVRRAYPGSSYPGSSYPGWWEDDMRGERQHSRMLPRNVWPENVSS